MRKALFAPAVLALTFGFNPAFADYRMQLNAVAPTSAAPGATVRLTGTNFGAAQAGHRLILRHQSAQTRNVTVSSWSNTQITAVLPADAIAGANTIAILNPVGQIGPVNASRHVPISIMATLKPGFAPKLGTGQQLPAGVKAPVQIKPIGCPIDPAAQPLRAIHPRKLPNGTFVFYVHAPVKNIGTAAFQSGPGQAMAVLRQGTNVVKTTNLTNIPAGGSVDAGTTIQNWRLSDEFPPDFTLEIVYGPDIALDSNPNNDDCRMNNNRQILRGADVMRVLRMVP